MKTPGIILSIAGLLTAVSSYGQGYCYVFDPDKFVFVREEAHINSPVVDSVYILQVLKTGILQNGWVEVCNGEKSLGWVHQSRLKPMPAGTTEHLDRIFDYTSQPRSLNFVVGTDLAHIIVSCEYPYPQYDTYAIEKYPSQYSNTEAPVIMRPQGESVSVIDLRRNQALVEWGVWYPVQNILLYSGRLFIEDQDGKFCFIKNNDGKEYMSVMSIRHPRTREYPKDQIDAAIKLAREFKVRCEGKTLEEIYEFSFYFNDRDDNAMLECLHTAYYNGDSRAQELYPLVLKTMTADGAGGEEKWSYERVLWIMENTGMIDLGQIDRIIYL